MPLAVVKTSRGGTVMVPQRMAGTKDKSALIASQNIRDLTRIADETVELAQAESLRALTLAQCNSLIAVESAQQKSSKLVETAEEKVHAFGSLVHEKARDILSEDIASSAHELREKAQQRASSAYASLLQWTSSPKEMEKSEESEETDDRNMFSGNLEKMHDLTMQTKQQASVVHARFFARKQEEKKEGEDIETTKEVLDGDLTTRAQELTKKAQERASAAYATFFQWGDDPQVKKEDNGQTGANANEHDSPSEDLAGAQSLTSDIRQRTTRAYGSILQEDGSTAEETFFPSKLPSQSNLAERVQDLTTITKESASDAYASFWKWGQDLRQVATGSGYTTIDRSSASSTSVGGADKSQNQNSQSGYTIEPVPRNFDLSMDVTLDLPTPDDFYDDDGRSATVTSMPPEMYNIALDEQE